MLRAIRLLAARARDTVYGYVADMIETNRRKTRSGSSVLGVVAASA
jgi:hypothetical protein